MDVVRRTGVGIPRASGAVTVHCPFPSHGHLDRTPSLRLYLDDNMWHCFGCGQKGDVVEWVSQTEGVGWREAIDILDSPRRLTNAWGAEAAVSDPGRSSMPQAHHGRSHGDVELPDPSRTPASRVSETLAVAWRYYSSGPLHEQGVAYLARRGIDVTVLERLTGRAEVGTLLPAPASS
jgi:hypothetical protein